MSGRRRVLVLSPHFDDVALSLGQSLLDGALSRCRVQVRVAFGRTNWTVWVHPSRRRAAPVSLWRRIEEGAAGLRFGYRWRAGSWEESVLRTGDLDPNHLLDPERDLSAEPLVDELAAWVRGLVDGARLRPDLVLVPAGLGGHLDHRLLAVAATRIAPALGVPVGWYEDRPYAAWVDPAEGDRQVASVAGEAVPVDVSAPITATAQRWVRRCYPSQIDDFFRQAMAHDLAEGNTERVWFPVGSVPGWLRPDG